METSEEARKNAQKLADAINKILKEIDPTIEIDPTPIMGILIMQFPANHDEHKAVQITAQGKICMPCVLNYAKQLYAEGVAEKIKYAE